jgi:6-phosphogluconate dehydrogenase
MQLIAETYSIMKDGLGMTPAEMSATFREWNQGVLSSYLIEITAVVLSYTDPETGQALVELILDEAEQKGTGRWTARNALDLGVPLTGITEAVYARVLSGQRALRTAAEKKLPHKQAPDRKPEQADIDAIRDALYASKIVAYAQGFQQMTAASKEYGWDLRLGEVATIWRGGCIIRARFLDRIVEAYKADSATPNLILQDYFRDAVLRVEASWRGVVTLAVKHGVAIPAFSSSLSYYDGLRRARGPANLLQGLRDYFGAHATAVWTRKARSTRGGARMEKKSH